MKFYASHIKCDCISEMKKDCIPEMKKDCIYKITLVVDSDTHYIVGATCGCPAGKPPSASCKHVGALCYVLEEYCCLGNTPEYATCTEKLQEWNKPQQKHLDSLPVTSLALRRNEILCKEK